MVWDKVSGVYDFFETVYNGKVYNGTGVIAAEELEPRDRVLECACGTGAISVYLAPKCRSLTITDMSKGMLYEAEKKCRRFTNVRVRKADLTNLRVPDGSFDKVVAGNVIHLLDDPEKVKAQYGENPPNVYGYGHTPLYADVIDAIKTGREPYVTAEDGRRALELVLAIYKSAAEGRAVKLPLEDCSTMDFAGRFDR